MVTKELTLATGGKYPLLQAFGEHIYVQGAMRDTLTFKFNPAEVDYNTIDRIFGGEINLKTLVITETIEEPDESGAMQVEVNNYTYNDYIIKLKSNKEKELLREESYDQPAAYRDVIVLQVAQTTYSERQAQRLQEDVNSTSELLVDLIGGAI